MSLPPQVAALLEQGAARPHRPQMGLIAIPESAWIELGDDQREKLVLKRRLLAERHAEVFGALPGSEAASQAVATLLFDHLPSASPRVTRAWARCSRSPRRPS